MPKDFFGEELPLWLLSVATKNLQIKKNVQKTKT